MKKDIQNYFELNSTPDVNLSTIWDEFKAVIRRRLISWNSIAKAKRKKYNQIQNEITEVKRELKRRPGKKKSEKQLKFLKQQSGNIRETKRDIRQTNFAGRN